MSAGALYCSLKDLHANHQNVIEILEFDVNKHRPKRSRGNEKDKLPSGVEPRSNDQQTSTPDTEPRSLDKTSFPLMTAVVVA